MLGGTAHCIVHFSPGVAPDEWIRLAEAWLAHLKAAGYEADEFNACCELDLAWIRKQESVGYFEGFVFKLEEGQLEGVRKCMRTFFDERGFAVDRLEVG